MTDSTTPAITPEKIAELRALFAKATGQTKMRPACPKLSDDMLLVSAAVNALPALLDLAASALSVQAETGWRDNAVVVAPMLHHDGRWLRYKCDGFSYPSMASALSVQAETGWRSMGSAPRDGTHILACRIPIGIRTTFNTHPPTVVHWFDDGFYTSVNELAPEHPFEATAWMPLPAPPSPARGEE